MSIIRENLMADPSYRPYVGCSCMSRARWNGKTFDCRCGWESSLEPEFIEAWKQKHKIPEGYKDNGWRRH